MKGTNAEQHQSSNLKNALRTTFEFKNFKQHLPAILVIVAILVIGEIIKPGFASLSNISSILTLSGVLIIASISQSLIILSGNEGIDLSIGAVMSAGALIGPIVAQGKSSHLVLAIITLIIIGSVIGLINGFGVQIVEVPPLVMTLIMASVINGFALAFTKGKPAVEISNLLLGVGKTVLSPIRILFIIAIITLIAMTIFIKKSKFGKSLYLVGNNRNAARLSGLKINKVVIMSYVIAAVLGILAGLTLVGYTGSSQLEMAESYTLLSIAAVVIGGVKLTGGEGSFVGAALGAVVLITLNNALIVIEMPNGVREFIQGTILLFLLILYTRAPKLRQ